MDSPTSQSVASYLSNHAGFQSWLAQHANQDIASLRNDPQLNSFREEYNKNLNLGKFRTDPAQNTNIDQNTFMQGVEMVKNMGNQITAQMMNKQMDHAAYPESLKSKSENQLRFIMKDAYEALKANPDNPNAGYYQDEINYCLNELARRRKEGPQMQANAQANNVEQLLMNVTRSLITAQNGLVDLVELLNQGFMGGGGEAVETNTPMASQDIGASGQLEHLKQVANEILPQVQEAAQTFQAEAKYFSSFSNAQSGVVAIKKASVITKYTTGIKSLQEAHDKVDKVCQFANNFPYFVLNYNGFKALCNFKTACNNLKKDIENLQKI
mgnify:CR=1 FL=1